MDGLIAQQPLVPLVWTPYGWMPMEMPEFSPGTDIWFSIPVTNLSSGAVKCKVTGHLHQGAGWGTGDFMEWPDGSEARFESSPQTIPVGQTVSLGLPGGDKLWTTQDIGGDPERDLTEITLYYEDESGNWVEYGATEKYGIYRVTAVAYEFTIGQPSVNAS